MNRKKKPFLILCLVLAVLLGIPIFGWAMVLHVFGKCEQIIMEHESHEALLAALKPEAVLLLVCSGLIVMGVTDLYHPYFLDFRERTAGNHCAETEE